MIFTAIRNRTTVVKSVSSRQVLQAAMDQGDALAAGSDEWAEHARQLMREEDLRLAFRAMYLSLLSGLHSAGLIYYQAQRTNWRYVQTFRGDAPQRSSFASLTRRFDDVWYGQRQPDPEGFAQVSGQVQSLLRSSDSPRSAS